MGRDPLPVRSVSARLLAVLMTLSLASAVGAEEKTPAPAPSPAASPKASPTPEPKRRILLVAEAEVEESKIPYFQVPPTECIQAMAIEHDAAVVLQSAKAEEKAAAASQWNAFVVSAARACGPKVRPISLIPPTPEVKK